MKIPTKFKLLGQTITVEFQDDIAHFDDLVGCASYRKNKIILQPSTKQTPINKEKIEHNFLHELMHFILYYAGGEIAGPLHKKDSIAEVLILVRRDGGMYFDNCGIEARDILWALRKMELKLLREHD